MRKIMHAPKKHRLLAALSAAAVLVSSMAVSVSAFSFSKGDTVPGIGTSVVSGTTYNITNGLEYNKSTFVDKGGLKQTMLTMEFNPDRDPLMALTYQPKPSYGYNVKDAVNDARNAGYTVYGGINGEFFSMNSANYGTLEGILVTNGKIVADSASRCNPSNQDPTPNNREVVMTIDKDGKMDLVESRIAYHFYVEGKEQGNQIIETINKRYVGTNWWDPLCYFDGNAGGKTYTVSGCKGVEVVFKKKNGTELKAEGTLQGEVVSVNKSTYGTTFADDEFVLFAQAASPNYGYLANLKPGQKVQIYAEETVESSKEIMKKAISVSSANYPIVKDGKDNLANIKYKASGIAGTYDRPQRTAIGVKADGTYVFFCSQGRHYLGDYSDGLTIQQLTDIMLGLGCVMAVNLDGGGSTTMVAGNDVVMAGTEGATIGYMRPVASSILIVARDEAVDSKKDWQELNDWLYYANCDHEKGEYSAAQWAQIKPIADEADALLKDPKALNGDYKRVYMDLIEAMGQVKTIKPKTYISLKADDWSYDPSLVQASNDEDGALILSNKNKQWPYATFACKVSVPMDSTLYYDVTVSEQGSFKLKNGTSSFNLNALIAPNDIDSGSGDIAGRGKTYTGQLKLSDLNIPKEMKDEKGNLCITGVEIWPVTNSGGYGTITIRTFGFENPYNTGDVDNDGKHTTTDARMVLRHIIGDVKLTGKALSNADINADGKVNTDDAWEILLKALEEYTSY